MFSSQLNILNICFHFTFTFQDGEKIPNCCEVELQESSLRRAKDIEKILLSLPPSVIRYSIWMTHENTLGEKYVDI